MSLTELEGPQGQVQQPTSTPEMALKMFLKTTPPPHASLTTPGRAAVMIITVPGYETERLSQETQESQLLKIKNTEEMK